jgi:membrane protein required for colicin V production
MTEFLSNFGWVDAAFAVAILLGILFGIKRGLSHELAVLLSFVVAIVVTCAGYDPLANWIAQRVPWNLELLRLVAVVVLLFASLALAWLVRAALGLLMSFAFKGWFERVGGAIAGGIRWALTFLVGLLALSFVPISPLQRAILYDSFAGRELLPLLADSYNDLAARGELLPVDRPAGVEVPQMVMPPVDDLPDPSW